MPTTYKLIDWPSAIERERLGKIPGDGCDIRAVATTEFRNPKCGEWYISGAVPEAYRALSDLDVEFAIAELVLTRLVVKHEIMRYS